MLRLTFYFHLSKFPFAVFIEEIRSLLILPESPESFEYMLSLIKFVWENSLSQYSVS